jgi:hypothetical protein
MFGGSNNIIGPSLQQITSIDHDCIGDWRSGDKSAFWRKNFETASIILEKEGDCSVVYNVR